MEINHTESGGFSIHLGRNEVNDKPLQMARCLKEDEPSPIAQNKIVMESGSRLQIIDTEDSANLKSDKILSNTEIVIEENARLEIYKIQNLDDKTLSDGTFSIKQNADSFFKMVVISFNGGDIRNNINVDINGKGADTNVFGLYLMDRKQRIENKLKVNHFVPECTSNTKFNGILDNESKGSFSGHIYVAPDAQKTNAYQNNSNIILTNEAKIDTRPFLEIYADDVKCSHGTSTGQLDKDAMFYMRQRGISFENARMLLMYAFAAEISNHIDVEQLREHIDDMIKRRLKGELSSCDKCVLQCYKPKEYV